MRTIEIIAEGRVLCVAVVADGHWTRFKGLLGRSSLPPGRGLLIQPCKSVHTLFMRFPIDVVYLTRESLVAKVCPHVVPFRLSAGGRSARSVLELPEGSIESAGLQIGQRLDIVSAAKAEQVEASGTEESL